ncbi:hypothetical protein J5O04_10990 [Corynebacterium hindlerae]|uniref:hypothetical protein n=1 Tax=Corynebacterium hindlerae TaxID=699041 RepID=UPI001AD75799|nr:hypothetical protein [Corynebacterium hindlerae]QTH59313.1 hypothetical protein J5O04_10990 [Corynebacterium hindlerae]
MSIWGNGIEVHDIRKVPGSDREFFKKRWVQVHGAFRVLESDWVELTEAARQRIRIKAVGLHAGTAMIVGKAAGELWRLWILDTRYPIELSYPKNRAVPPKHQWKPGVKYRRMHVPREDWLEWKGIRLTTLERTVIDICRFESFAQGLAAVESYLKKGNCAKALYSTWSQIGNLHGKKKFLKVMKWAGDTSESAGESLAKALMIEAGIDMSKVQQNPEVVVNGKTYRVDFLYDSWLTIEINGEEKYQGKYGDPITIMRNERRREEDFLNDGYSRISTNWADMHSGKFIHLLKKRIAERRGTPK